jgi:hypothetical protein
MLSEFLINMAKNGVNGLHRKRETLDRIVIAIAKLKFKTYVDAEDAREAMEFFNVILLNYQQTVPASRNPRDITYEEVCIITKEQQNNKLTFIEAIKIACARKAEIESYLGDRIDFEYNWKLRPILDLIRKNNNIDVIDCKPILLQWKGDSAKGEIRDNSINRSEDESMETDVTEVSDATKEVLSSIYPSTKSHEISSKKDLYKFKGPITASNTSVTSDPKPPKLYLKHAHAAIVRTNEDLASENNS